MKQSHTVYCILMDGFPWKKKHIRLRWSTQVPKAGLSVNSNGSSVAPAVIACCVHYGMKVIIEIMIRIVCFCLLTRVKMQNT